MANEVQIPDIGVATPNPKVAVVRGDTSDARAVQAFGEIGGDIASGIQRGRTRRAAEDIGSVLDVAHGVVGAGGTFDPDTGDIQLPDARTQRERERNIELQRQANEVRKRSEDAFGKINRMIAQRGGSLQAGGAMARTLVEREMRNILSLTPGFEREVRQAASSVLGFDPTGGTMNALFTYQDPEAEEEFNVWEDTDVGKAGREYLVAAQSLGVPLNEQGALRMASEDFMKAQKLANLANTAEMGGLNSDQMLTRMYAEDTADIGSFTKTHMKKVLESGGTLSFDTESLLASKDQWVQEMTQEKLQALRQADVFVNADKIEEIEAHYQRLAAPYERMINAGSMQTLLENNRAVVENLMWNKGVEIAPDIMMSVTAFGEGVTTQFLESLDSVTDEGQLTLLQQYYPKLTQIYGSNGSKLGNDIGKTWTQILKGQKVNVTGDPETDRELRDLAVDNMTDTTDPETTNDILEKLSANSPKIAISVLANKPDKYYMLDEANKKRAKGLVTGQMMTLVEDLAQESIARNMPLEFHGAGQGDMRAEIQRRQQSGAPSAIPRRFSGQPRLAFTTPSGTEEAFNNSSVQSMNTIYRKLFNNIGEEFTQGAVKTGDQYLNLVSKLVQERVAQIQRDQVLNEVVAAERALDSTIESDEKRQQLENRLDSLKKREESLSDQLDVRRRETKQFRNSLNIPE